ncbi:hypothetical protein WOLCODRAFT_166882 [Wolfiporia cocos MD-104 SS10]|uniref:F-box domain-containing protein n=1 Tax=Wolfiporia cocos (strain MD-104) TaxID=742152 RepID=A0A2H3J2A0_WOLCO|nr:hypothetical protein WOLCODRAFT_166882 [Wolfiporia cocos MD-104 SS10]
MMALAWLFGLTNAHEKNTARESPPPPLKGKKRRIRREPTLIIAEIDRRCKRLPPEITDFIIDFLHDDTRTLKACSLVCHSWLPATRYHLFDSVRIRSTEDCLRFRRLLDRPLPRSWVDIAYHIRQLVFHDFPFQFLDLAKVQHSFSKLREVRSLYFRFWMEAEVPEGLIRCLATALPQVTELHFQECFFVYQAQLLRMICAFPNLKQLRIDDSKIFSEHGVVYTSERLVPATARLRLSEDPEKAEESVICLEALSLMDTPYAPTVAAWLVQAPFQLRLKEFRLRWLGGHQYYEIVSDLLERIGDEVEELEIGFFDVDNSAQGPLYSGLRTLRLPKLKILEIEPLYMDVTRPDFGHAWLPILLNQVYVTATELEEIAFRTLPATDGNDLAVLPWTAIDQALVKMGHKFPGLTVLFMCNLKTQVAPSEEDMAAVIMNLLPRSRRFVRDLYVDSPHNDNGTVQRLVVYTLAPKGYVFPDEREREYQKIAIVDEEEEAENLDEEEAENLDEDESEDDTTMDEEDEEEEEGEEDEDEDIDIE